MRSLIFLVLLFAFLIPARAQKTADMYFAQIPSLPSAPCERATHGSNDFMTKVKVLLDEMTKDLNERNRKSQEFMKNHKNQAREYAVANSGLQLTPEQMKVMQQENKHMTAEQKKKLADEVMQQNMNVSMGELESLKKGGKKVDPVSAENWAKAYSTELEAQREINPEKADADQKKNMELTNIQQELDYEIRILNGRLNEFTERLNKLQEEADSSYVKLRIQTDPIHAYIDTIVSQLAREKEQCSCAMEEKSKEVFEETRKLLEQIQMMEYFYCLPLTPQYIDIMKDYQNALVPQFERCNNIEKLQEEVQFRQIGVRDPEFQPGTLAVESVRSYVVLLTSVYKYKISDKPLTQEEKEEQQTIVD